MGLSLADVMDALAGITLTSVPVTAMYAWPQESVVPPAWIVGYPDDIEFDVTYHEGADRATFPCYYVVGKADTKSARDALSVVIGGSYAIKDAIEGESTLTGGQSAVADTVRVVSCRPISLPIGGVTLLAARFDVEVVA